MRSEGRKDEISGRAQAFLMRVVVSFLTTNTLRHHRPTTGARPRSAARSGSEVVTEAAWLFFLSFQHTKSVQDLITNAFRFTKCQLRDESLNEVEYTLIERFGLPITRAAPASQTFANNAPRDKSEECKPCLPHKFSLPWSAIIPLFRPGSVHSGSAS